jgi:hypothetical protein
MEGRNLSRLFHTELRIFNGTATHCAPSLLVAKLLTGDQASDLPMHLLFQSFPQQTYRKSLLSCLYFKIIGQHIGAKAAKRYSIQEPCKYAALYTLQRKKSPGSRSFRI